jgi:hypothetical protein
MRTSNFFVVAASVLALGTPAFAQSGAETLVLLPETAELPDVVTGPIDLPKDENGEYIPAEQAVENSAAGLATANDARENGRAFGQAMAAQAQENREQNARGARPDLADLLPDRVPDHVSLPTLPDVPAAPALPELPVTPPVPERPETPVSPPGRP